MSNPSPCERCPDLGACCRFLMVQLPGPVSGDVIKFYELHDGVKVVEYARSTWLKIEHKCSALTEDGLCALFGKPERPRLCGQWPNPVTLAYFGDEENPLPEGLSDKCVFFTERVVAEDDRDTETS